MKLSRLTNDDIYQINIYKSSGQSTNIRYAYAWSTDNERFNANSNNEGVYYIRNKKSKYYLTKNTNNNRCVQKIYDDTLEALWVIDYISSSTKYRIKNSGITSYGLCRDTAIDTNNYYAIDNSSNAVHDVSINYNSNDGTYTFTQVVNGVTYALSVKDNSTSANEYVTWSIYNASNQSQRWYLETASYRVGDANHDNAIRACSHKSLQISVDDV